MEELAVWSPSKEQVIAHVEMDDPKSINARIKAAVSAQSSWSRLSLKDRAEVMFNYRSLLKRDLEEVAALIQAENGKTLSEAHDEVKRAVDLVEFASSLPGLMTEERLMVSANIYCTMSYRPLGVVASISPFNFPLMIPHWTAPLALTLGNALVLKPSPHVPLTALRMATLLKEAGLPEGLFSVVNGGPDQVTALIEHEDIKAVSFVGSSSVAEHIYRQSSAKLKRALCLGSAKNFLLVLPDADPAITVKNIVASAFGMAGQRCMAASVAVLVKCDHIIGLLVKASSELKVGVDVGPLITKSSKERVLKLIEDAVRDGAHVLLDGRTALGQYVGPTILSEVHPDMEIARQEVFGPVLCLIRTESIDEAIRMENHSRFGNGASVYTNNGAWADQVTSRLSAGMIGVNIGVPVPKEPFSFGGRKHSKFGVGDITGASAIHFWTDRIKCTTKWRKEDALDWMS